LAVADSSSGNTTVNILLGDGNGGFGSSVATVNFPLGTLASGFVAADFDKDGKTDFALTDSNSNQVFVELNKTTGVTPAFATGPNSPSAVELRPMALVAGDVNSDGYMD